MMDSGFSNIFIDNHVFCFNDAFGGRAGINIGSQLYMYDGAND